MEGASASTDSYLRLAIHEVVFVPCDVHEMRNTAASYVRIGLTVEAGDGTVTLSARS